MKELSTPRRSLMERLRLPCEAYEGIRVLRALHNEAADRIEELERELAAERSKREVAEGLEQMAMAQRNAAFDERARSEMGKPTPEGWKLVPVTPTEAMLSRAEETCFADVKRKEAFKHLKAQWREMLAAAPEVPK